MIGRGRALLAALALALAWAVQAAAQTETPNRSFHNSTSFRLEGRHLTVTCEACHEGGVYKGTPNTCYACHWIRRQDDRYQLRLGAQCEACHRPIAWTAVRWDHAGATGTPLNSAHKTLGCDTCHRGGQFKTANLACVTCHQKDYDATRSPNHRAAGFPPTCEACHKASDETFTQARFDHNATFPLVGVHATVACATCHRGGVFAGTPRDCVGCHRADYDQTKSPNHAAAGFPTTCATCHRPSSPTWGGASSSFNHNAFFPLVGQHATEECAACHVNGRYNGTPRDCVGCHRDNYDRTQNPNHLRSGFSTSCEQCHRPTDSSWQSGAFSHNQVFPLVGVHAQQECTACHKNGQYGGTPRDCVGCHRSDYDRTQNPNHKSSGFPTTCEQCHRPTDPSWGNGNFNHNQVFPLVGVHAQQSCTACHKNGQYGGTPRDCVGCHRSDYDRTQNPNHKSSGFPTTCEQCHRPTDPSWGNGNFNHNQVFPLVGAHAQQSCTACHKNGVYAGTPRDCVGCHRSDYDRTQNPNHKASGFPTTCQQCHRPTDPTWGNGSFNHNQVFPLQGQHARVDCTACHQNNRFAGTPRDCYGCHRTDYERTQDPNHRNAGFPTTCQSCHRATDSSWSQGVFSHTRFPLTGPHNRDCASCHLNPGNYREFSCTVCHERGPTDNEHRGRSGYRYDSNACYSCHPNGKSDD